MINVYQKFQLYFFCKLSVDFQGIKTGMCGRKYRQNES
jgi:hypothetical protein